MQQSEPDSILDALPEGMIVLTSSGEIRSINKAARTFLLSLFDTLDDKKNLADLLENTEQEILATLKTWSRTRAPLPASIRWRNWHNLDEHAAWRCEGFMLTPAQDNQPATLLLRCIPGRGQLSEFTILNQELAKTQHALKRLRETRDELARLYEQATVTLKSIGDAVITTDLEGKITGLNPIAEVLTGWTIEEARGLPSHRVFNIINEITREPHFDPIKAAITSNTILELSNHTILVARDGREYVIEDSVAPIRHMDGKVIGAVLVFHDVTNDRLARRQLEYLAQHDMLTSLHNRHYFEQELGNCIKIAARGKVQSAILYIDLDEFKVINDSAGHAVGDSLLTRVAELFSARLRQGDILARLGGDEFGVLIQNISRQEVDSVVQSYLESLQDFKFSWEDTNFNIHASIGVTIIDQNARTTAEVFRRADVACYVAKQAGKNRYHIFDEKQDTRSKHIGELDMLGKVEYAIKSNGFELFFQPILARSSQLHNHYEVLLRLNDNGNRLTAGMFIPVAERHGLMPKIDQWVIEQVVNMIETGHYENIVFAVNLSGTSLDDHVFTGFLTRKFENDPAIAKSLVIEITETAAVTQIEKAADFSRRCKQHGVRIALDDFGTGFSSFAYLKYLPVDIVKIDGLFVRDITVDRSDLAMVRSINHIAHSLGKLTVAEYVENQAIQDLLVEIGVDFLRGFHVGKPVARSEFNSNFNLKNSA